MALYYLIISFLSFTGIILGLIIGYASKEELNPGKKYLQAIKSIIYASAIIIFFLKNPSAAFIVSVALLIILFSLSKQRETLHYYAFPVMMLISWAYKGLGLIAILAFLYGLPLGSLYLQKNIKFSKNKNKMLKGLLKQHSGYLIITLILWIIILIL